jgi:phosphopantetheinyl transferase (holo-ACP synthase)
LPDYLASRGVARHHLSLSHEKGIACAVVVLEQ